MCAPVTVLCALLMTSMVITAKHLHRDVCVHQCQSRCEPLADQFLCCDCQTLCRISCETSEKGSADSGVRVSVSPRPGCRGLCGPARRRRSPGVREAALIARSVGLDLGLDPSPPEAVRQPPSVQVPRSLRLVSLSDEGQDRDGTLTARVRWDPEPRLEAGSWYLVSWQSEGDGLTANLLTNTTSVNLTLQPDTVYHFQVSSMSTGSSSECLEVDTRLGSRSPSSQSAYSPSRDHWRPEVVLGATAAILVFLLASASFLWVTRGRRRSHKDVRVLHDCDHFKVYPPPITLRTDTPSTTSAPHPQLTLSSHHVV